MLRSEPNSISPGFNQYFHINNHPIKCVTKNYIKIETIEAMKKLPYLTDSQQ